MPRGMAERMKPDMARAGIPKRMPGLDGGGGRFDFHALRTYFITLLDQAGATVGEQMTLASHAPSTLSQAAYSKPDPAP